MPGTQGRGDCWGSLRCSSTQWTGERGSKFSLRHISIRLYNRRAGAGEGEGPLPPLTDLSRDLVIGG